MKLQEATRRETVRIAIGVAILSVVMNIVFIFIGKWDFSILWGTLLGGGFAVANFFAMGLSVQKMAANDDIKKAKLQFQASYSARSFAMFVVAAIGLLVPFFNGIAVILPLLFPKFTILAMQIMGVYKPDKKDKSNDEARPEMKEEADGS